MSAISNSKFIKEIFLSSSGVSTNSGASADSPLPFSSADLMPIEAGMLIEKCYLVIGTAIAGTTNLDVGDDDDADGFIDGSLSVTLGTAGMYGYDAKLAGAYLRLQTAGATDAADIYVVPQAKYYAAAGKELKLACSGTNSAGVARVIVEGYRLSGN